MVFARKTRCARRDKKRDPPKDFGQNPGGTVYIAFSSINSGHAESAPGGGVLYTSCPWWLQEEESASTRPSGLPIACLPMPPQPLVSGSSPRELAFPASTCAAQSCSAVLIVKSRLLKAGWLHTRQNFTFSRQAGRRAGHTNQASFLYVTWRGSQQQQKQ